MHVLRGSPAVPLSALSLSLATSTTPASTPEPSAFCKGADPEEVTTRSAVHKLWRQPLAVDLEGSPNVALIG